MRKNILFNTTRQWNPGDQIIMLGILKLLRHSDFNIFIYNRHPSVWGKGKDNSFKPGKHSLENIDYYIHAGTPEWADQKLKPLFDEILARKIPSSFIGVGGNADEALKTFHSLREMLEQTELLTARDDAAFETLEQFDGIQLPCPGFLCGRLPTKTTADNRFIGLVFTSDKTNPNTISTPLKEELIAGYKRIIERHDAIIICHYVDEALEARTHFPNTPIYYSYDAKDFEKFYSRCNLVISPRLHGALLSAGLGVPTYIVGGYRELDRKRRLEGVATIGIQSFDTGNSDYFIDIINKTDREKESNRLIRLRWHVEALYLELFIRHVPELYDTTKIVVAAHDTLYRLEQIQELSDEEV